MHNTPQSVMDKHPNVQLNLEMNEGVDVFLLIGLRDQIARAKIENCQLVEGVKPTSLLTSPYIVDASIFWRMNSLQNM